MFWGRKMLVSARGEGVPRGSSGTRSRSSLQFVLAYALGARAVIKARHPGFGGPPKSTALLRPYPLLIRFVCDKS